MMKRLLALVFALSMMLLCTAAYAAGVPGMPAVGDKLEGFTVTERNRIESLGADTVTLTHDKTQARVIFVLNDDNNLGFSICFHTEPADDTGMLHILEHASCAASEKYPGRDVFFDAIGQAYLTGMNAWTAQASTNYYATSMDENQLEVLADFYLDCAFHSAILTEPNYFYREGWRYEMASPEDDLTINGIVYNEMQGSYGNLYRAAGANVHRTLFPDTYQARDSGGVPARIPDLSYQELLDFYQACYNPTNAVVMFYGDLDMTRFLRLLDGGYFAAATPAEPAVISPGQAPFSQPLEVSCEFPAAADAEDAGSLIYYSTVLTDADSGDYHNLVLCDVATTLLAEDSSPLMRALNASGIGSEYFIYYDRVGTQLTLNFAADNADPERAGEFRDIVMERLTEMTEAGFNQDMLQSIFASSAMALRLERNSGSVATTLFDSLMTIQETGSDDVLYGAEFYTETAALCVPGYAEERIRAWVLDNPHAALITTTPVPGLLERNEQALAEQLAQIKAGMTDEEKQQIIESTAAFNEWVELDTPQSTLDKLDAVRPSNVVVEYPEMPITTEMVDGITVMHTDADMDMRAISVFLDVSHLTDAELQRLEMLQSLTGRSTRQRSQEEISMLNARLVQDLNCFVTVSGTEDAYAPVLAVSFYAPEESCAQSVALVLEMLADTDISGNIDLLAQSIDSQIASYRDPETIYQTLATSVASSFSGEYALHLKLTGLGYLDQLKAALDEYEQDPAAFAASLEALRTRALTKTNARIQLVGDDGTARDALLEALTALPEASEPVEERPSPVNERRTALVGSTQASYLVRGITLDALGESLTGDKLLLLRLLSSEYLLPNLRLQMGAYNTKTSINIKGLWTIVFYRGSNAFDANEVIEGMPAYLESLDITQEQLDSYKLPLISDYLSSEGALSDRMNAMSYSLFGFTRQRRLEIIDEIRSATVEDVKALLPLLYKMLDQSHTMMITTAEDAAAHADALDATIKLP